MTLRTSSTRRSCRLSLFCWLGFSAIALAQPGQAIYTDALVNGWQNWGWATLNFNNVAPVHSGSASISISAAAWQAIYLHHDAFASSAYTNLAFWIHGGPGGGQRLQVQAMLSGTAQLPVQLAPLPANAWQQITLSLDSLSVANKPNLDVVNVRLGGLVSVLERAFLLGLSPEHFIVAV